MHDHPEEQLSPRRALSGLALLSAGLSFLSLSGCVVAGVLALVWSPSALVAVLALPLLGLGGAVAGGQALRAIRRSGGALSGRPPAVFGLFVGLACAVIQGATALSALAVLSSVRRHVAPAVEAFLSAHERGDGRALRSAISAPTSERLSDERLAWFFHHLERAGGGRPVPEFGLGSIVRASARIRGAAAGAAPGQTVSENARPVELVFPGARLIAVAVLDDTAMQTQHRVVLLDLCVLLEDGRALTLLVDGPGAALAARLGVPLVSPDGG